MGACVLIGIAAGPAEVRQPDSQERLSISDALVRLSSQIIAYVMILHERGTYQTLYFAFNFGSLMASSVKQTKQAILSTDTS